MPPNPDFPVSEAEKGLVLHAQLKLTENGIIMGCDTQTQSEGANIAVSVEMTSEEDARTAWRLLREGGVVVMELKPTFFAKLHGSVMDKYGFTWMFTVT